MKERGYTIYSGQGTLDQGIFRIATLGCLTEADIEEFLQNLGEVLDEMGVNVK
jgi:aspartate aminotransferase-like enzyme